MKSQGLRTTIYQVKDINTAKEWYTKAFETQPYFDEPFYVGFNIGGYELGLHPNTTKNEPGGVVSYWAVEDVARSYSELLNLGAEPHEKPTNVGGDIVVAAVKDPWGNLVGLIYNPTFTLEK